MKSNKPFILLAMLALVTTIFTMKTKIELSLSSAKAEDVAAVVAAPAKVEVKAQAVVPAEAIKAVEAVVPVVAEVPAVTAPPVWLGEAINMAKSMPYIGPFIVAFLEWLGVIASLLTALTSLLLFLEKITAKLGQKIAWLATANQYLDIAIYYVGYLSVFNVSKNKNLKTAIE